jgi:integrase/recombinase XerD
MSHLRQELDRYLTIRRSLGYDLGTAARILRRFTDFAESQKVEHVSTDLFLRWQAAYGHANSQTWAARFGIVRLFAQWLHGIDPAHEPLPLGLMVYRGRRSRPHIYSPPEVANIVTTAAELPSAYGLRGLTYATLFGLVAVTGMRISEALALDADDVDVDIGVLTIRRGKRGKARLTPLDASVTQRLLAYIRERDRLLGFTPQAVFVSEQGTRVTDCSARYNFALVCQQVGLRPPQRYGRHGRGPRIHDLRHSFAAQTMIGWYRNGQDAAAEMLKLTTYLGHTKPEMTYWYIEAVPELLELAAERINSSPDAEATQ